jgi:hypothetical protein
MPNFANSRASVKITNLEPVTQSIARNDKIITSEQAVPRQMIRSMEQQGMANQEAFSPGMPLNPTQPIGAEPRQFEYMIGQNIVQKPRSTEQIQFETIRNVIEMYDIAQIAIEVRQDELRNLDWNIVPADEDNPDETKKYESEIRKIRAFFEKPDGHTLFDDFQNQLAYDWLAFDALTIYPHLTKGGELSALEPVDGTTIAPLVDYFGRIPEVPAPAYVQWAYGMPWVWLTKDQLIYRPFRKRTNKLYGFSPIEWLLNTINTDIRFQLYFLQYFTEGSVPETWIEAPESAQSPEQIKAIQEMYDTVMAGDQAQKHKVKWIPFGSKVTNAKETKFDVNFPLFMLQKTCAAFKVTPAELGFTEKVNKSSGETQENVQYRRSIKPSAMFFARIYTGIINKYFNMPNLKFKFLNIEEQEDMLMMAQRDEIYIKNGVVSPDEVRIQRLGLEADSVKPVPRGFYSTREGFMPIDDIIEKSKANLRLIEAQADAQRAKANEQPLASDDINGSDKEEEVSEDIMEEETAEKAMKDFFAKSKKAKYPFKNVIEEVKAHKLTGKLYKLFQRHKEAFIADFVKENIKKQNGTPSWNDDLETLLKSALIEIYLDAIDEVVSTLSGSFEIDETYHELAEEYAEQRTALLVTSLTGSTRDMLRTDLITYMDEGLTPQEISDKLQDSYAFSEARANAIARTETGFAWNDATLSLYEKAGEAKVQVYDGDGCKACAEVNGEVWSLDYAREHLLQHPNCVRSFGPAPADAEVDRE